MRTTTKEYTRLTWVHVSNLLRNALNELDSYSNYLTFKEKEEKENQDFIKIETNRVNKVSRQLYDILHDEAGKLCDHFQIATKSDSRRLF